MALGNPWKLCCKKRRLVGNSGSQCLPEKEARGGSPPLQLDRGCLQCSVEGLLRPGMPGKAEIHAIAGGQKRRGRQ